MKVQALRQPLVRALTLIKKNEKVLKEILRSIDIKEMVRTNAIASARSRTSNQVEINEE